MLVLCRRWLSGDQLCQASSPGAGAWLSHLLIGQGAAGQCLFHRSNWWCYSPCPQLKECLHSWGTFPWFVCFRFTAFHFVQTWMSEWKLVMQWIKSLVAVSTEIFNRDAALQNTDYFPAEFYSCKGFTATVGRREWGGNVFPQELCRESLKLLSRVQGLQRGGIQRRSKADSSLSVSCSWTSSGHDLSL